MADRADGPAAARRGADGVGGPIERVVPGPGQESVWDYPRPPRRAVTERLRVIVDGEILADTSHGYRVLETAGAPVYYFRPGTSGSTASRRTSGGRSANGRAARSHRDYVGASVRWRMSPGLPRS